MWIWRMVRGLCLTQTQGYLRMKGAATMSIIPPVAYHFMLALWRLLEKFYRLENFLSLHPFDVLLDTLVIDSQANNTEKLGSLLSNLDSLTCLPFSMDWSWCRFHGAKDSPFAYFFINVNKYGWACRQMGGDHFYRLPLAGYVPMGSKIIKRKSAVS